MTDTPYTICVLGYGPHNMRLAQLFIEYNVHGVFYYDLTENITTVSEQMGQLLNMLTYGMGVGMLESKNSNFAVVPTIKRAIEHGLENYFEQHPLDKYAKRYNYSHSVESEKLAQAGFNNVLVYFREDEGQPFSLYPDVTIDNDKVLAEDVGRYIAKSDILVEDDNRCVMRLITPSWNEKSFTNFEQFLKYLSA